MFVLKKGAVRLSVTDFMTVYSMFMVSCSQNVYCPIAVSAWLAKNRLVTGAIRHLQANGCVVLSGITVLKDASHITFTFN
jgi:hypothetical protein